MSSTPLYQTLIEHHGKEKMYGRNVGPHIEDNLNRKFPLREYQIEAFQNFLAYLEDEFPGKPKNNHHLLFHMATGSGKTLIMAGAILDLYKRGYRNFLFYVHSKTIIKKTKENFLRIGSSKYQLSNTISIDGKIINIKEVTSFSENNSDNINIMFRVIHDLRNQIINPKENGFSLEGISRIKLAIIADEGHHYQADTKSRRNREDVLSWEETADRIFAAHPENIRLEFTATMPFQTNEELQQKYADKIIIDYPLKNFRIDGFSKEVEVIQTDSKDLWFRSLLAIVLSQYRKKLFQEKNIFCKPVIMFKSKTIKESKAFQKTFSKSLKELDGVKLAEFLDKCKHPYIDLVKKYLQRNKISMEIFAYELKEDFSTSRQIIVDSENQVEEHQIALNSLEDQNNPYRCIFAVNMLNEGWDVLNLFDIVRLYDTRDPTGATGKGQARVGKTTQSEAQLIGRGARYFPFTEGPKDELHKRKYDKNIDNPMRLCETLVYHSTSNPKYIQELQSALIDLGITPKKSIQHEIALKEEFKNSEFFKNGVLYLNERIPISKTTGLNFKDFFSTTNFAVDLETGQTSSVYIFEEQRDGRMIKSERPVSLADFSSRVIFAAISRHPLLTYSNLTKRFPMLESINEFIQSEEYLGHIEVVVRYRHKDDKNFSADEWTFTADEYFTIANDVMTQIAEKLSSEKSDFVGSKDFSTHNVSEVFRDKIMNFNIDPESNAEFGISILDKQNTKFYLDITKREWFCHSDFHGTSEEKQMLLFFEGIIPNLKEKYSEIYLFRNERFFKLHNISNGAVFEPDFVLIMKDKVSNQYSQIFLEPKGDHLIEKDQWKEDFLVTLQQIANPEGGDWEIIGLPFYTKSQENKFRDSVKSTLLS
jgi:type III restriction enzyme